MNKTAINLAEKFSKFSEQWSPRIVAEMNDYEFKIAKIQNEFVWHQHEDTDEVFLVIEGEMVIEFRDGSVDLAAGEMFVVPKGVEHKPYAKEECKVMFIEKKGTRNTGDVESDLTAQQGLRV